MAAHAQLPPFLELDPPLSDYDRAAAAVLPVPFEASTTYLKGTARGPRAILEASAQVEWFDDELHAETCQAGIATLSPPQVEGRDFPQAAPLIEQAAAEVLRDGKLLVALGGEHSITIPLVRAAKARFPRLGVIQLDAHADLRDTFDANPHSHACTMRRVSELCLAVQVGVRSLCREEADLIEAEERPVFLAHRMRQDPNWADHAIALLPPEVYLTIDLDFFDPSVAPAVGTPEPGGFTWHEALAFLRRLARERRIVAFDVVELCPIPGQVVTDFTAAKLVYRLIGYTLATCSPA